jgi:hypothetical protein
MYTKYTYNSMASVRERLYRQYTYTSIKSTYVNTIFLMWTLLHLNEIIKTMKLITYILARQAMYVESNIGAR